jgi:hypothetical protein
MDEFGPLAPNSGGTQRFIVLDCKGGCICTQSQCSLIPCTNPLDPSGGVFGGCHPSQELRSNVQVKAEPTTVLDWISHKSLVSVMGHASPVNTNDQ